MFEIVVLVSGAGSNLQAIIEAINSQQLPIKIIAVIADRSCLALERAQKYNLPTYLIERKIAGTDLSTQIMQYIPDSCQLIVLAGFLSILDQKFIAKYPRQIINLHPSLLPKYGGKGMWGKHVHQAVLAAKETISGCSVHYVSEQIDAGEIIIQESVVVEIDETVNSLATKIAQLEHKLIIQAIQQILQETIRSCN
jgi:phosphoribosylglycinamide formyltransferase-1